MITQNSEQLSPAPSPIRWERAGARVPNRNHMRLLHLVNIHRTLPFLLGFWLAGSCGPSTQAALPPEQLLPADTLAVLCLPNWGKAMAYFEKSPYGQLWADPAVKPFRKEFIQSMQTGLLTPLQGQLGVKFSDYGGLIHGQVTLALTPPPPNSKDDFGVIVILDAGEKKEAVKGKFEELKKKWIDGGQQVQAEKIRGIDFTTVILKGEEIDNLWKKAFSTDDDPVEKNPKAGESAKHQFTIGLSDSLLLISEFPSDIEKVLIRQSGGLAPALAEQPMFQQDQAALFRDALGFGWINFKPVQESITRRLAGDSKSVPTGPLSFKPDKLLASLGLAALKTISFKINGSPEGTFIETFLAVPEANRAGLLKILAPESKEAAPPVFIPADTVKFTRWRLDGPKTWSTLESVLSSVSPEVSGLVQLGLSSIGKDKDPNFDFKRSFIGNLGDDLIKIEKPPRSSQFADFDSPPSLFLVGSPRAVELANALKVSTSLLPPPMSTTPMKEREFLGRKVYAIDLGPLPDAPPGSPSRAFSFAASGGYLALSSDAAVLEEYLRSSDGSGKKLRDAAGLADAMQKVGGANAGFFTYENQSESLRAALATLKSDKSTLEKLFLLPSVGVKPNTKEQESSLREWLDFSLLPPYERLSRYFHFSVVGGKSTPEGISFKVFTPTPPGLR